MNLKSILRDAGEKSVWHLLVLLVGCSWMQSQKPVPQPTVAVSDQRVVEAVLPDSYAAYRSQLLSQIDYKIEIDLTSDKNYTGKIQIKFYLRELKDLTLDFSNGEIDDLKVNGFSKAIEYNNYFLTLKKQDVSAGENLVEITYRHSYGVDDGLVRFVDPKDKKIYIFSNFASYGANQLWPCFDQPDLFVSTELIVKTPKDWQVISSSPNSTADYAGGVFYWLFPRAQKTNIQSLSLAAGFYHSWEKNINTGNHPMTLRFWARQSIKNRVLLEDWFLATKNGFIFYEKEFDVPFGLTKYDQVLVPGSIQKSMSGFAAPFFDEKYFLQEKEAFYLQKRQFTQMTLEKLAQWWVGQNIVPLTWDDLWISQSFSKYMSYEALVRGTLFSDADRLLLVEKLKYNTKNLQGIYMWRWMRDNTSGFLLNLRNFLNRFSHASLSTEQFFEFWKENTKQNFENVFQSMDEPSRPLEISYDCGTDKAKNFALKGEGIASTFQFKRIKISAFRFDGPRIVEMKSTLVDFKPPSIELKELNGLDCARLAFVLIDPQNRNFLNWILDERSLKSLKENSSKIEDENIRFYAELLLQKTQTP